jgi:hypothetical protein
MKERVFIQTEEYYEPYDKWFENNIHLKMELPFFCGYYWS